jgi:cobalt-zinc-cadmium efflux system outer membrane protein
MTTAAIVIVFASEAIAGQQIPNDPLPARVTLEQVLQIFNERSPRAAAERATVDVAAADRITATTSPNPTISYGGSHLFSGQSTGAVTQHQVVVDQPLLVSHQRQARLAVADLNVAAEQARVSVALAARRVDVRQAFVSLLARQEDLRILEASKGDLDRIEQVVRGRAQAGDRSQYDVLRIETEGRLLDVDLMNATTDVDDAAGHLAALLGFPGWKPRADGALEPGTTPTDFDTLWTVAQKQRPTLLASAQQQSVARGNILLAERERLPVPTVTGGALFTNDVTGTSAVFGLSVPLPLFDRNRGAIAKAGAEANAAARAQDAEVAETRAEIERARATYVSRQQVLSMVDRDIVQRMPELRRMAEDAYREGRGDILELLDATRSLKDMQMVRVKQLEMTRLAEEDVIAAAGLDAPVP